jgi:YgiT-type zinc finger domain-containing protein
MRKCDICGQEGVRVRRVTKTYGKGDDLVVIESVPMMSCPHCKERYFTADTLHEIERLKLNRKTLAVRKPIGVLEFAGRA